ncbi:unnamed protein product [Penicillium roqueforti FM164]|uniref:Genomic scaffold, ProqFM164S01 n=1 Tax=Penicillium roqueforti (strain FM164) TaxID=1365484 RepID=W6PX44_PENRF|nr:unnamed protein product [Penicillium roqueforti FM164]
MLLRYSTYPATVEAYAAWLGNYQRPLARRSQAQGHQSWALIAAGHAWSWVRRWP